MGWGKNGKDRIWWKTDCVKELCDVWKCCVRQGKVCDKERQCVKVWKTRVWKEFYVREFRARELCVEVCVKELCVWTRFVWKFVCSISRRDACDTDLCVEVVEEVCVKEVYKIYSGCIRIILSITKGSPGSRGVGDQWRYLPGTRVNVPAGLWWCARAYLSRGKYIYLYLYNTMYISII